MFSSWSKLWQEKGNVCQVQDREEVSTKHCLGFGSPQRKEERNRLMARKVSDYQGAGRPRTQGQIAPLNSRSVGGVLPGTCGYESSKFARAASQMAQVVKNPSANAGDVKVMGLLSRSGRPLEKEMATHYHILAWRIPRTEKPGGQQFTGLQRVRHCEVT